METTAAETPKIIDKTAIDAAAEKAGLSTSEFVELSIHWMINMCEITPDFAETDGWAFLYSSRKERGIIPELHPFLERLFAGVVVLPVQRNYNDLAAGWKTQKNMFLRIQLATLFIDRGFVNAMKGLYELESAVRDWPELKAQAEAIGTLIDSERTLKKFINEAGDA